MQGIRIPSEEQGQRRLLSRTRAQLVQERAALKQKIRMKAHQFGLIGPEGRREMSETLVQELLACSPSEAFRLAVTALWNIWQALDQEIRDLETPLKHQAQTDEPEAV